MGNGIAHVCAMAGIETVLYDVDLADVDDGLKMIRTDLDEDVDQAMVLGYGHPIGPLRLTDLIGLDVQIAAADYLHEALGSEAFRPPELLERMVAEGKLGKKTGRGFYSWDEDGPSDEN